MQPCELISFADADELARAAAESWLQEIEATHRAGQPHCVALSGGRIAQKFFARTAELARGRSVSFSDVHFFWADERCVSPHDPESNFRLARELLLTPLAIPEAQIHRLRGEDLPKAAVKEAETELRRIARPDQRGEPVLDLVILGMGEDGHVASLFPNAPTEVVDATASFLAVENSPKPPPRRISLSFKAIAAARKVWVLISGGGKAVTLQDSLRPSGKTPLARVLQSRSQTRIFSDLQSG